MPSFPQCTFGPMHLRGLLRARMLPGERLIAWGVAAESPGLVRSTLALVSMTIPILGWVMYSAIASESHLVLVLTDKRLFMLDKDRESVGSDGRGVHIDAPIESVAVRRGILSYRVRPDPEAPSRRLRLIRTRTGPAIRLRQALEAMADDRTA